MGSAVDPEMERGLSIAETCILSANLNDRPPTSSHGERAVCSADSCRFPRDKEEQGRQIIFLLIGVFISRLFFAHDRAM
jgi:hypothetical protein